MKKKIFICEYVTGGGYFSKKIPEKLFNQAKKIIAAILSDFSKIPNLEVIFTQDCRYKLFTKSPNTKCILIKKNPWLIWKRLIKETDFFLPIAPETNNELFKLVKLGLSKKKKMLSSSLNVIKTTSSKYRTFKFLTKIDLPSIPSYTNTKDINFRESKKWVVKRDDGAGCEENYIFNTKKKLENFYNKNKKKFLIQPFVKGVSFSVNSISRGKKIEILNFNKQYVSYQSNRIVFKGTRYMNQPIHEKKTKKYLEKIITSLPGFKGFFGIDFLVSKKEVLVVDINPRITTSYNGLSKKLKINVGEKIFNKLKYNI